MSFTGYSQDESGLLKVQGISILHVKPDETIARFSFEIIQMDYEKAIQILGNEADQLKKKLKKAGFDEENLKTTMFHVNINRIYQRGQPKDSGYVARQIMELEFPYRPDNMIKLVNTVSDKSTGPDVTFSFQLSERKRENIRLELISKAVNDARQKAEVIAKSSKTRITGVKEIIYGNVSGPQPQQFRMMESAPVSEPGFGGFDVQDLTLNELIEITYLIKTQE